MNEESQEAPAAKRQKLDDGQIQNKVQETDDVSQVLTNFVDPAEMERLREFKVLDEVKSNDEDSNHDDSDSSDGKSEDIADEDIDKMLEEDLPEGFKGCPKPKEKPYVTRQKIVLEDKGVNHFEVLPLDWMVVRHYSGMPIYMHRATRVCTLSKPYFLGKGNARRHEIPISAIPCLAYRKALEEEEKQKDIDRKIQEQIQNGSWVNNSDQSNDKGKEKENVTKEPEKCPFRRENSKQKETENLLPAEMEITEENSKNKAMLVINEDRNRENLTTESTSSFVDNKEGNVMDNQATVTSEDDLKYKSIEAQPVSSVENELVANSSTGESLNKQDSNNEIPLSRQPVVLPGGIVMPPPRVETVNTSWKTQHLTHEQLNAYCKSLFVFKTINIMHFNRWVDRRKYTKVRKALQYPTLPEGTKLITIPAQPVKGQDNGGKANKRDWVMNMNGRSFLSVFHEYARRALQKQPVYEFMQLENASTPYQATVYIGGMQYGVGRGSSKRQAKSAAAKASIHILIPEMKDHLEEQQPRQANDDDDPDFTFFDYVGIEDPRISEFCAATCEPSPHAILRTCLLRNFGAGDRHIHTEMKKLEYQKIELTMKVGKHSATVVCRNKKKAKQRASQAILQALHPHVRSWGSLLRLYGSRSVKSCKEKKLEEQQITLLQDKARQNEPNYAVLEKLRNEMTKLRERDDAVVPIGTLLMRDDLPTHSGSNLNNVDL